MLPLKILSRLPLLFQFVKVLAKEKKSLSTTKLPEAIEVKKFQTKTFTAYNHYKPISKIIDIEENG